MQKQDSGKVGRTSLPQVDRKLAAETEGTAGADWKTRHDTEQTMHNAWRKRAEEAELRESEYLRVLTLFAGGMNTSCADCEALLGNRHSEQCLIWKTISGTQATKSALRGNNPDDTVESSVLHSPESVSGLARQAAERLRAACFEPESMTLDRIASIIRPFLTLASRGVEAELRKAVEFALEWFAGFPHKGEASGFDVSTAAECYDRLSAALASTRDEQKPEDQKLG